MKVFQPKLASAIRLFGNDAADFLGRLSTTNLAKMPVGHAAQSLFLTGSAQVIAPAIILKRGAADFLLIVDQGLAPQLAAHLESMHFSEDLGLERKEVLGLRLFTAQAGKFSDPTPNISAPVGEAIFFPTRELESRDAADKFLVWSTGYPGLERGIFLGETKGGVPHEYNLELDENFWELLRINAKIPDFGREWQAGARALDVGFLPWIHRDKGCYPGQEVVQKSLNIGHPAKALVRLGLVAGVAAEVVAPLELSGGGKILGTLTSFATKGEESLGLAVVKWEARNVGTQVSAPGLEFIVEGEGENAESGS